MIKQVQCSCCGGSFEPDYKEQTVCQGCQVHCGDGPAHEKPVAVPKGCGSPSPEWTDKERLSVIQEIATRVHNSARTLIEAARAAETIVYVCGATADFLEANRANILRETK